MIFWRGATSVVYNSNESGPFPSIPIYLQRSIPFTRSYPRAELVKQSHLHPSIVDAKIVYGFEARFKGMV